MASFVNRLVQSRPHDPIHPPQTAIVPTSLMRSSSHDLPRSLIVLYSPNMDFKPREDDDGDDDEPDLFLVYSRRRRISRCLRSDGRRQGYRGRSENRRSIRSSTPRALRCHHPHVGSRMYEYVRVSYVLGVIRMRACRSELRDVHDQVESGLLGPDSDTVFSP